MLKHILIYLLCCGITGTLVAIYNIINHIKTNIINGLLIMAILVSFGIAVEFFRRVKK